MKNDSTIAYLGIGSNIEPREEHLQTSVDMLKQMAGVELTCTSSVYETEPWGKEDQGAFLNAVLECRTEMQPETLRLALKDIEAKLGREQTERWGPRKIDLDILLFGAERVETEVLHIPHPRMRERRFVLVPLVELAPDARHPVFGSTMSDLLATCPDMGRVWKHSWQIAAVPGIAERNGG